MKTDLSALILALILIFVAPSEAFCPSGCTCLNFPVPEVVCENAALSHIPYLLNPRLKKLVLRGNSITEIRLDQLGLYSDLEVLDLSQNGIFSIEKGAFYKLQQLKVLKLNANMLATLELELFSGLRNLRVLDLSENGFGRIPTSAFSDLRLLELLNLSRNSLKSVSPGAFAGLDRLKELYLGDNQIPALPKIAFRALPELRILDIRRNFLKFVLDGTFQKLIQLEQLNLAQNDIEAISERAFEGLGSLRHLDLSGNALFRIPTLSFRPLTELEILSLDENPFLEVETSSFEGLQKLRRLSISKCSNLNSIHLNAFSGLYSLESLHLSRNSELKFIHPMAFEAGFSLKSLKLSENRLSTLPNSLLNWEKLDFLALGGNAWQCDCGLEWLIAFLQEHPNISGEKVSCASPESLAGLSLTSLSARNLPCSQFRREMDSLLLTAALVISALVLFTVLFAVLWLLRGKILAFLQKGGLFLSSKSGSRSNLYGNTSSFYGHGPDYPAFYGVGPREHSPGPLGTKQGLSDCFYYTDTLLPAKDKASACLDDSGYYSSASLLYARSGVQRLDFCQNRTLPSTHAPDPNTADISRDSFRTIRKFPVPITEL